MPRGNAFQTVSHRWLVWVSLRNTHLKSLVIHIVNRPAVTNRLCYTESVKKKKKCSSWIFCSKKLRERPVSPVKWWVLECYSSLLATCSSRTRTDPQPLTSGRPDDFENLISFYFLLALCCYFYTLSHPNVIIRGTVAMIHLNVASRKTIIYSLQIMCLHLSTWQWRAERSNTIPWSDSG